MNLLSPRLASQIASDVYYIEEGANGLGRIHRMVRECFRFGDADLLQGRTGGWIFQKTTGFVLLGEGRGQFAGDKLIAVRGTASLADAITDGNVGLSTSTSGSAVHNGFNRTFESFRPALQSYVERAPASTTFHCVGHSLGGALAGLVADWISHSYGRSTQLYTFGAPRVGKANFANGTSHRVGKFFRCTHGSDPVPMVPLWPFIHAPVKGLEYRLDGANSISVSAHLMGPAATPGYLNTANHSSWEPLADKAYDFLNQPVRLRYENSQQASFSTYWADRLSAAIITLLKDAGYYAAVMAQAGLMASFTFYDLLARTMEKIAQVGGALVEQLKGLLGHMLAFAGKAVSLLRDLTFNFIRWVFEVTLKRLYTIAREALKATQ